jgi:hypothetical protein
VRLSADGLRAHFAVYGRFQSVDIGGQRLDLRSHLEIFERSLGWPQAADARADLVAVMMNPGGSRPLDTLDPAGWAPTLPDRTQYQLMKLALLAQAAGHAIRHVRVINLSDLRTPKSAELFAALATLGDDRHSMFSVHRQAELQKALGDDRPSPVVRAWGLAKQLEPLARRAIAATSHCRVLGLTDNGVAYRHPLPQRADFQLRWLEDMSRQMALTR